MTTLYHYTCDHWVRDIEDDGFLRTAWELYDKRGRVACPLAVRPIAKLVWLTDLDVPVRDALGLTQDQLACDRTAHRFRVTDTGNVQRYIHMRLSLPADSRDRLEDAHGAMPMHWWVSSGHVPVVLDPWRP